MSDNLHRKASKAIKGPIVTADNKVDVCCKPKLNTIENNKSDTVTKSLDEHSNKVVEICTLTKAPVPCKENNAGEAIGDFI